MMIMMFKSVLPTLKPKDGNKTFYLHVLIVDKTQLPRVRFPPAMIRGTGRIVANRSLTASNRLKRVRQRNRTKTHAADRNK